jgi:hypothetical protein
VSLTVYALAVPLHLAVEHGVLVPGQHLLLGRHLQLPALHLLHALSHAPERRVKRADNRVDVAEALAVSVLLVTREAPWDFPAGKSASLLPCIAIADAP